MSLNVNGRVLSSNLSMFFQVRTALKETDREKGCMNPGLILTLTHA